jgi:hypothetical protein
MALVLKLREGMDQIHLVQYKDQWQTVVNTENIKGRLFLEYLSDH